MAPKTTSKPKVDLNEIHWDETKESLFFTLTFKPIWSYRNKMKWIEEVIPRLHSYFRSFATYQMFASIEYHKKKNKFGKLLLPEQNDYLRPHLHILISTSKTQIPLCIKREILDDKWFKDKGGFLVLSADSAEDTFTYLQKDITDNERNCNFPHWEYATYENTELAKKHELETYSIEQQYFYQGEF